MSVAPVIRGLLDTSVVVDYREGWPAPIQFFQAIRQSRFPEFSQITAMTLLTRCQSAADMSALNDFFFPISTIYPVTAPVVRRAYQILESHTPPIPLTPDDAIVAATAIVHKLPLYTLDPTRFAAVAGLSALQPY